MTDGIISNSLTITPFNIAGVVHNNASGLLSSSLITNADVAAAAGIVDTKLATISTAGKVSNSATTATSSNIANTIVARNASGNFSAGTITATLNGNATTATTATDFSGSLFGNVTGTQGATVVSFVGGQSAANVAAATILANAATSANTTNAIVRRNGSGGFSAGIINMTDGVLSGNLALNNSTSSTVGNVTKAGNRFIHNFGTNNTFAGVNAGNFITSGTGRNVGLGNNSLAAITTGNSNTAAGSFAMQNLLTGSSNIGIGNSAGSNYTTSESNNIIIGNSGVVGESATIRIGSGSQTRAFIAGINGVTTVGAAVPVLVSATGQLGIISSSASVKHNIQAMDADSEVIYQLNPVKFAYNNDPSETQQYGLIAEEVKEVFSDIVVDDVDGKPFTVQYHVLPVLLLNEMKKQHMTIEQMSMVISSLQAQVQGIIERVKNIEDIA